MNTTWKWVIGIGIGILLIGGTVYLIKRNKRAQIKDAALKTGLPEATAAAISESTDPAGLARQAGLSAPVAAAIASGFSVSAVSVLAEKPGQSGYLKYTGTGTFYSCQEPAIRSDTGRKDENGNALYDCYISVKTD